MLSCRGTRSMFTTLLSYRAGRLAMVMLLLAGSVESRADDAPAAISWEALCAVTVCRGTGHDGVFAAQFSPDGQQLVVEVLSPAQSGLFLVNLDGQAGFWTAGQSAAWLDRWLRLPADTQP